MCLIFYEKQTNMDETLQVSLLSKVQYQRLVGKLIYLAHTRPGLAYGFSIENQFMHDPRDRHLWVVDRALPYLRHLWVVDLVR